MVHLIIQLFAKNRVADIVINCFLHGYLKMIVP